VDSREVDQGLERSRAIRHLAALLFVRDTGLLAQGGTEDDRAVLADESPELGDEPVHRLVTEEDGVGKLALLFRSRLERERVGLHVAPVHVLQMRPCC
jgi:hypothetical protein